MSRTLTRGGLVALGLLLVSGAAWAVPAIPSAAVGEQTLLFPGPRLIDEISPGRRAALVGDRYFYGDHGYTDYRLAALWYARSALDGDSYGQFSYGYVLLNGYGVEKDPLTARALFRAAAQRGEMNAQYALGDMYYFGQGVARDLRQAVHWYRRAAMGGHDFAQYSLGYLYDQGEGVPKNSALAVYWWRNAAARGNEEARRALLKMNGTADAATNPLRK